MASSACLARYKGLMLLMSRLIKHNWYVELHLCILGRLCLKHLKIISIIKVVSQIVHCILNIGINAY